MKETARIAVVGCGALGGFYGARLARAGHEVHLLIRSDYDAVRANGLRVQDADGGFVVHPPTARVPEEIGPCEAVIVGLKTTANDQFARLLPPLVGPGTAVLTLQNGLGNEERLAEWVGPERVWGGLCFVCLNRIAPGVIVHLAHGRVVLGGFRRPASARTRRMADWFRGAGLACDVTDNLEQAHWEKLIWNIPFNGLGVAAAAGYESVLAGRRVAAGPPGAVAATDVLLGDDRWRALVRELMDETIRAARGQGFSIDDDAAEIQIERTREMGAYRASTLIDFERGRPLEVESLFGEPLRRARAVGVSTPRLAALHALLRELDPGREDRPVNRSIEGRPTAG